VEQSSCSCRGYLAADLILVPKRRVTSDSTYNNLKPHIMFVWY